MFELSHVTDGVDFLVEWDSQHQDGRLRAVVYDRLESAQEATQLAVSLCVPVAVAHSFPAGGGQ